ncbi:MAG: 50S ribosomal protein L2 [Planctomycetota bacterium]|nr:MAG: 50S ribosomal protein L2 [Planctomycetota bacterium]
MGVKQYKPTSPGRRGMTVNDWAELTHGNRNRPERSLVEKIKKSGGRNHHGRITNRNIGGGHKAKYRKIDFKRDKDGVPAKVVSIEYDPRRTARIALLHYADGEKRYILAPLGLEVGQTVLSGENAEPKVGNAMPLRCIPTGLEIHNVELQPRRGGQLGRSAGTLVKLMAKEGKTATIMLPSGEMRKVPIECRATIGQIGNTEHNTIVIGKAGRHRWMGKRPVSRGCAMNPHSHPMGGGEGHRSGGRHPQGPTGILAKGGKTRKPKARSNKFIVRARKKRGRRR